MVYVLFLLAAWLGVKCKQQGDDDIDIVLREVGTISVGYTGSN